MPASPLMRVNSIITAQRPRGSLDVLVRLCICVLHAKSQFHWSDKSETIENMIVMKIRTE